MNKYIYLAFNLNILIFLYFVMSIKAFSSPVYLKIEMPTYTSLESRNGVGIGYQISEHFDIELGFNQFSYSINSSEIIFDANSDYNYDIISKLLSQLYVPFHPGTIYKGYETPSTCTNHPGLARTIDIIYAYDPKSSQLYVPFHPGTIYKGYETQSTCTNHPRLAKTPAQIYDGTLIVYPDNIITQKIEAKLNTYITSIKFKPFKQINRFTPYLSAGVGPVAINYNIKNIVVNGEKILKSSTKSENEILLGFELGFGSKINLIKKVDLDINLKYFNYGKPTYVEDSSKGLNGYKMSLGIIFWF